MNTKTEVMILKAHLGGIVQIVCMDEPRILGKLFYNELFPNL